MAKTAEDVLRNDGRLEVAVGLMDKALPLHFKLLGADDYSLLDMFMQLLNTTAMEFIKSNRDDKALYLLKHAEKLIRKNTGYKGHKLISNIYNNMALSLQRNNFVEMAKEYLKKAKSINFRYNLPQGVTNMNYGALLSSLGK